MCGVLFCLLWCLFGLLLGVINCGFGGVVKFVVVGWVVCWCLVVLCALGGVFGCGGLVVRVCVDGLAWLAGLFVFCWCCCFDLCVFLLWVFCCGF